MKDARTSARSSHGARCVFPISDVNYQRSCATFSPTRSICSVPMCPTCLSDRQLNRRRAEASQKGCMKIRRGQERSGTACSLPLPGRLPEPVAGWSPERAAGSGFPQTGKSWKLVPPQGSAGE